MSTDCDTFSVIARALVGPLLFVVDDSEDIADLTKRAACYEYVIPRRCALGDSSEVEGTSDGDSTVADWVGWWCTGCTASVSADG